MRTIRRGPRSTACCRGCVPSDAAEHKNQGVTYTISYDYNPNGGTGNDVALIPE